MIYMKSTYLNLYSRKNNYSKENIIPVRYFENPTVTRFPKKKKKQFFFPKKFSCRIFRIKSSYQSGEWVTKVVI